MFGHEQVWKDAMACASTVSVTHTLMLVCLYLLIKLNKKKFFGPEQVLMDAIHVLLRIRAFIFLCL